MILFLFLISSVYADLPEFNFRKINQYQYQLKAYRKFQFGYVEDTYVTQDIKIVSTKYVYSDEVRNIPPPSYIPYHNEACTHLPNDGLISADPSQRGSWDEEQ